MRTLWKLVQFLGRAWRRSLSLYVGLALTLVVLYQLQLWLGPPASMSKPPQYPNALYFAYLGSDVPRHFETEFTTNDNCSDVIAFYEQALAKDDWKLDSVDSLYARFLWEQPITKRPYVLNLDCEVPTTPAKIVRISSGELVGR